MGSIFKSTEEWENELFILVADTNRFTTNIAFQLLKKGKVEG